MRILIADDEYWIRENLKQILEEEFAQKHNLVISEATNGAELLEKVGLFHPDLAFVDIQMPVMDGLTAIREAKKKNGDISWVILTGHSEFEYAKQAMKLEVCEYLLKPVEKQEVVALLHTIEQRRRKERQDISSVISCYLWEAVQGLDSPQKQEEPMSGYRYQSTLLVCEEAKTGGLLCSNLYEEIERYCARLNEQYPLTHSFPVYFRFAFLLLHYYRRETDGENRFAFRDNQFVQEMAETFAKSRFVMAIRMLTQDTLRAVAQDIMLYERNRGFRMLCRNGSIVKFELLRDLTGKSNAETEAFFAAAEELLLAYSKKSLIYYLERCTSVQDRWRECRKQFNEVQETALIEYLTQCLGVDRFRGADEAKEPSLEELIAYISKNAQNILYAIDNQNEDVVDKAIRIMGESYAENISMVSISEKLGISPNYLSALFHKKMGVGFVKYLTQIRMTKAKELLLEKNISVQEVAERIGYQNTNYFTKVFRTYFGLTPTEFQMQSIL